MSNRIALDVQHRKLTRSAIKALTADPAIAAGFIGKHYIDKRPAAEWNKAYLEKLTYAAIAESFNLDYLLYLDEVADSVAKAEKKAERTKKMLIIGAVIGLVIIAGVIMSK